MPASVSSAATSISPASPICLSVYFRVCVVSVFIVVCPAATAPAPLADGVGDDGLPRELAGPPQAGASRQKAEYEFYLRAPWPARSGTDREGIPNFRARWHRRPSDWTGALQFSARYSRRSPDERRGRAG